MASKNKKVTINLDVTDWAEEYQALEPDLSTFEQAIQYQQKHGIKPQAMGPLLVIGRFRGDNKEEILRKTDKMLLGFGAGVEWSSRIASEKRSVTLDNGQTYRMRAYVNQVIKDDDVIKDEENGEGESIHLVDDDDLYNGPDIADVQSKKAAYRAMLYIKSRVPGYIFERMKILAANHGDVDEAADFLKAEIDKMVARLKG